MNVYTQSHFRCEAAIFKSEGDRRSNVQPRAPSCPPHSVPATYSYSDAVNLIAMPLFHIGGLSASRIVSPPTVARGAVAFGPPPTRLLSTAVQGGGASRWRGPVTWVSAGVTVAGLYGLYQYQYQKQLNRQKSVGRPELGGPFTLTDIDGKPVSNTDLMGHTHTDD